jgi:hypothetical protein
MDARDIFLDQFNEHYDLPGKYHPHWEPDSLIELGAVGHLDEGDWQQDRPPGALGDLGDPRPGPAAPLSFASGDGISIRAALKGTSGKEWKFIGDAAAGIKIHFARANSLVVAAPDTTYEQLPNEHLVAEKMIDAWKEEDLHYDDEVVVGIRRASGGLVVASGDADAGVDVTTSATIRQGVIDIAEVKGHLGIVNQEKTSYHRDFPNGMVLAYRALRLTEDGVVFFRHPGVHPGIAPESELIMPLPEREPH